MGKFDFPRRHEIKRRVFVAVQGGGALGAFAWGALEAILEDPHIDIVGASGTSSGALTCAFLIEGLTKGGKNHAAARMSDCWNGLSKYRTATLPWGFESGEALNDLYSSLPIVGQFYREALRTMGHANHHAPLNHSPILGFLAAMERDGKGLDFSAFQDRQHHLIINATRAHENGHPWNASHEDERVFINDAITAEVLAASGSIAGLVPAIKVGGELLRDGAYRANPHLASVADHCEEEIAELIVLRTRSTDAARVKNGRSDTNKAARAFFNKKLDDDLEVVRGEHPHVPLHVVEPETDIDVSGIPEMRFDKASIEWRRKAGYRAAQGMMQTHAAADHDNGVVRQAQRLALA